MIEKDMKLWNISQKMAILDEKECERDDVKKIIQASECMKHYKTIETVKKDNAQLVFRALK